METNETPNNQPIDNSAENAVYYNISSAIVTDPRQSAFTEGYVQMKSDVQTLINSLNSGKSFVFAKWKDGRTRRRNDSFESSNIICIDIDNGMTLEEGIKTFNSIAVAIYTTRNHQKEKNGITCDRFRVVIVLPKTVDKTIYKLISKAFVHIYGHDYQCVDPCRGYLTVEGGKVHTFDISNRLDFESLFQSYSLSKHFTSDLMNCVERGNRSTINVKKIIDTLINDYNVSPQILDIVNEKLGLSTTFYNNTRERGKKPQNSCADTKPFNSYHKIRKADFNCLKEKCSLFNNVNDSDHGELFHLATNLIHFEGGIKLFKSLTKDRPFCRTKRSENYYSQMINSVRQKNYLPENCSDKCRFHKTGECNNEGNLVSLLFAEKQKIKPIPTNISYKSIQDGRILLRMIWEEIKKESANYVFLIKAPTGIGKSNILQTLLRTLGKIIIAGPRKNQIANLKIGEAFPEIPDELKQYMEPFVNSGLSPIKLIGMKEFQNSIPFEMLELCKAYSEQLKSWYNSRILKTTHDRLFLDRKIKNIKGIEAIYIDEDISEVMNKQGEVDISYLSIFKDQYKEEMNNRDRISPHPINFLEFVLQAPEGQVISTKSFPKIWDSHRELNTLYKCSFDIATKFIKGNLDNSIRLGNLIGLFSSDYFIRKDDTIHYIKKNKLPHNVKTVILSATADEAEYRSIFGDRLKFIDLGNIESKGKLIQFNSKSFSKTSIDQNMHRRKEFNTLSTALKNNKFNLISFKALSQYVPLSAHFFATEGINELTGEDLVVFGTPYPTEIYLKLKAAALGYDYSSIFSYRDAAMSYVKFKGFSFYQKMLSKNEEIRNLQLNFTYKHIVQAVGRARYISHDCLVLLFSNFPIHGFEQISERKLDKILLKITEKTSANNEYPIGE